MVIISNCVGTKFESMASAREIVKNGIQVGVIAADEGKVKIEKFDDGNFGFWKMQIEDYLYQKKLHQPLT
ncbi:hypothetical protein MTR_4g036430 [Medicago truncatula]|uniref:Uncharacterized protein n=1 Tax=Medicago truncatula TaxID=3880 RepID=G7JSE4_MEDTR|nr:hypothetical protein MTR_4g036430 [Medicago truncatula]